MLHAKFQDHRISCSGEDFFKVFTIYGHGCHLGHMSWTIYNINVTERNPHLGFMAHLHNNLYLFLG